MIARWCGVSPWTLEVGEVVAAELGRKRGPAAAVGLWLRLWLPDRSAISMQLVSRSGLDDALDRLGLANPRVGPS